ncbi:MAG: hypothetical protein K5838_04380 [Elusimicrobiales bacterium]|nr:hypothetical protein [Elusimicrobiales bacterium]
MKFHKINAMEYYESRKAEILAELLSDMKSKKRKLIALQLKSVRDLLAGDLSRQFTLHSIKIMLYPDVQEQNHWKEELLSLAEKLYEIRLNGNQKMSMDMLMNTLFKNCGNLYDFENTAGKIIERMIESPIDIDIDKKFEDYRAFCNETAKLIISERAKAKNRPDKTGYGAYTTNKLDKNQFMALIDRYLLS